MMLTYLAGAAAALAPQFCGSGLCGDALKPDT